MYRKRRLGGARRTFGLLKAHARLQTTGAKGQREDRWTKVLSFFRKTVSNLQHGKIDPRIRPEDLGTFRELAEPLKRDVKRIVIGRVSLTSHL